MNKSFVALVLGGILILEGIMMLACWLFALSIPSSQEEAMASAWAISTFATVSIGLILVFLFRREASTPIFRRDAFAVVALAWIFAGIFAALPFFLPPLSMPFWDSLFECYSGLTTTGATVIEDLDIIPQSILLWRSVLQWIGGLGILILFVAVLGLFGVGGKSLFTSESSQVAQVDLAARIKTLSLSYLGIYVAFTCLGVAGLATCGLSGFDSVCLSLTSISTGGFSPYDSSVSHIGEWYAQSWLVLLMFIGGIAFPVHYQFWMLRRWDILKFNTEFRIFFMIILSVTLVITVSLLMEEAYSNRALGKAFFDTLFQVVSILTTTGLVSQDFNTWPPLARVLLLGLMIIGGCAGSTAGGMKVARIIVFAKVALRHIRTAFRPNLIIRLQMNGRSLEEVVITGVVFYVALYFTLLTLGILVLAVLEPDLDLTSYISAVLACFNNIGPGLELVGPTANYQFLTPVSKLWLSLLMLMGRLELYAVLMLFLPSFWRKF